MTLLSRRVFIEKITLSASVAAMACGACNDGKSAASDGSTAASADPCADLSGVSENDRALRRNFAYVKESPVPDNHCDNCNLYLPATKGATCGGCMLFKGPVHEKGYCTYWAPRLEQ